MNRPTEPLRRIAAIDPDARAVKAVWVGWSIATVIFTVLVVAAPTGLLPLLGTGGALLLLWPLWRGGRLLWRQMLDASMQPWQGSYYEYDGRQIRVLVDDIDGLWISAADVFDALGLTGTARDIDRARLVAGRDGLRAAPGERLLCFTERGLSAFLERRTDVRSALFQRWLHAQVVRPHHRRLVIAASAPAQSPPS